MDAAHFFYRLRGAGQLLLDQVYPPRCPACHANVSTQGNLCAACYQKLHVISDPQCAVCGIPFAIDVGEGTICAQCLSQPPVFDSARSVWVYQPVSARMIKRLKLDDHPEQLAQFCDQLLRIAAPVLTPETIIVPVPMYWKKLLVRRYNPAAWLAHALADAAGCRCEPSALVRVRAGKHQRGLSRQQRLKNLRSSFAVKDIARPRIKNASVLLVDDVITTGATANACARALKNAGAKRVDVVTLAHTLLEDV